jgi:hypothetical protein
MGGAYGMLGGEQPLVGGVGGENLWKDLREILIIGGSVILKEDL